MGIFNQDLPVTMENLKAVGWSSIAHIDGPDKTPNTSDVFNMQFICEPRELYADETGRLITRYALVFMISKMHDCIQITGQYAAWRPVCPCFICNDLSSMNDVDVAMESFDNFAKHKLMKEFAKRKQ